jgi:hypothetical protein
MTGISETEAEALAALLDRAADLVIAQSLLSDLDRIITTCHGSGDPLRERIAEALIDAQTAIYDSDEWEQR